MNYEKIYNDLVAKAREENTDDGAYYEKHHIIPKSLGGTLANDNLVKFTPRQHYIAHLLLFKIYKQKCVNGVNKTPYYKMLGALSAMVQFPAAYDDNGAILRLFKFGSVVYDNWKRELAKVLSARSKNRMKNLTEKERLEYGEKLSRSLKKKWETCKFPWTGRKHSEKTKQKMRDVHRRLHLQEGSRNSQFGTKCMYNEKLKKTIHVKPNEIQKYLDEGWKLGAVYNWESHFNKPKEKIRKERVRKEREHKLEKRMAQAKREYTEMYKVYCESGFDGVKEKFGYKFSQVNFVNQCKKYVDEYKPQNGKKRGK